MSVPTESADRQTALNIWLQNLPTSLGLQLDTMSPASSDASFRRYWRITSARTNLIVMDAPPPQEDCQPFLDVTHRLAHANVTVPEVLAHDLDQGFMLLSDLGRDNYYAAIASGLDDTVLQAYYRQALDMLVKLQHADSTGLAAFDAPRLRGELELFEQWFVKQHHQTELTLAESTALDAIFEMLCAGMA
ncbi:MAG TPA: phosphotransferase, partial [Orrella sp.]